MEKTDVLRQPTDINGLASQKAAERARVARWDIDIAVFLFGVLIIVLILLFQHVGLEIVSPVAALGLGLVAGAAAVVRAARR